MKKKYICIKEQKKKNNARGFTKRRKYKKQIIKRKIMKLLTIMKKVEN